MSRNFINDFQQTIYRLLSGDDEIRLSIDKIYLSVVQDAKYPFLLINILNIKNISQYIQDIYEINFEICVFARDKNSVILTSLADKITNKLITYSSDRYNIASIKACNINFSRSADLITSKLTVNYKALLKSNL
ncbi:MAG: hypothetical protein RCG15_02940 [Candidatus Rickettsia vulgarisii]